MHTCAHIHKICECMYMCVKVWLYMSMYLYMSIFICIGMCVYTLLRKYIFQKYTNVIMNKVSQSEHICEQHSNVTFTRSSFSILRACQPALLEAFAAIYQTLPNSPQI